MTYRRAESRDGRTCVKPVWAQKGTNDVDAEQEEESSAFFKKWKKSPDCKSGLDLSPTQLL